MKVTCPHRGPALFLDGSLKRGSFTAAEPAKGSLVDHHCHTVLSVFHTLQPREMIRHIGRDYVGKTNPRTVCSGRENARRGNLALHYEGTQGCAARA